VDFESFERAAREVFDAIPEEYRDGVDGLVVSRDPAHHPHIPDLFTLGECLTESFPSDFEGPETVRSTVVLHWGSFARISERDPDFDWEEEIWETITHEVRHHLEWLARDDTLEGVDYAVEQDVNRADGVEWDPFYYQYADPISGDLRVAEGHVFIERLVTQARFDEREDIDFRWNGIGYRLPAPAELGDIHYVEVVGGIPDPPPILEIVLVRKRSWMEDAKRLFGQSRPRVLESTGRALPTG